MLYKSAFFAISPPPNKTFLQNAQISSSKPEKGWEVCVQWDSSKCINKNTQVHKYKYTNTQIHKHKYANTDLCVQWASEGNAGGSGLKVTQLFINVHNFSLSLKFISTNGQSYCSLSRELNAAGYQEKEERKQFPHKQKLTRGHLPHHRPPGVGFPPSLNSFGLDDSISQLPSPATLPLIYTQYTIHTQCHPSSKCRAGNLGAGGNNYPAMGWQAAIAGKGKQ